MAYHSRLDQIVEAIEAEAPWRKVNEQVDKLGEDLKTDSTFHALGEDEKDEIRRRWHKLNKTVSHEMAVAALNSE